MQLEGYWYKNNKLFDLLGKKHVDYILQYPKVFNLDKDYIIDLYKSFNERLGQEGKAREELIKQVSNKGWIRIRHYSKPEYWSIQFDSWRRRRKDVRNLVEYLVLEKEVMNINSDLQLLGYVDNYIANYSFQNGGIKTFLQEKTSNNNNIILTYNFLDLTEKDNILSFLKSVKGVREYFNYNIIS